MKLYLVILGIVGGLLLSALIVFGGCCGGSSDDNVQAVRQLSVEFSGLPLEVGDEGTASVSGRSIQIYVRRSNNYPWRRIILALPRAVLCELRVPADLLEP